MATVTSKVAGVSITTLAGKAVTIGDEAFGQFRAGLRGRVLQPGDDDYASACVLYNGMHQRRPAVIVQCSGAADVIDCVKFARQHDLLVSVKGGGHNSAGNALCDGGLAIDLSRMNGVHVDPNAHIARCMGGATWGDVDREGQAFGLTVPGGAVSTTGIAGLTLGGGLGWLRRKYGLSLDSLISVDVVTADGQLRKASERENSDLFWAIRGGGGNFGVITSFEFRMHPIGPMVQVALAIYPMVGAAPTMRKWRDFMLAAPDEISSNAFLMNLQPSPMFPEELWGKKVLLLAAVYAGSPADGARTLQEFEFGNPKLFELRAPFPWRALQAGFDTYFTRGKDRHYWKSLNMTGYTDEVIDAIVALGLECPAKGLVDSWAMGGAIARVGEQDTAFTGRSAPFVLVFNSAWADAADDEANRRWTRDSWQKMKRFSPGSMYMNFPGEYEGGQKGMKEALGVNYARLVKVKTKYDPTNLFRLNQNIQPEP